MGLRFTLLLTVRFAFSYQIESIANILNSIRRQLIFGKPSDVIAFFRLSILWHTFPIFAQKEEINILPSTAIFAAMHHVETLKILRGRFNSGFFARFPDRSFAGRFPCFQVTGGEAGGFSLLGEE